mgnify:CR=1 FL=1
MPNQTPHSLLFTDLYELTMMQAYHQEGMNGEAVFEVYFRQLPETRNFLIAAGIDDVIDALENLRLEEGDLDFLRRQNLFSESFLKTLADFRFQGEVRSVPEGTVVFPNEPLMQIRAPIQQAQLIETLVLNQMHVQSMAAAKSARIVHAAQGKTVVDFGSRRAHGSDAALKMARAFYLSGGAGTSNVLAGRLYDVPIFGTMAHSYVQAHVDEREAFAAFARFYPNTTLLVDTYDTLEGVKQVIDLVKNHPDDIQVRAVRLDSGDLLKLAQESRALLDEAGLSEIKIFASGGLDEHKIAALLSADAPIDGFGVGSKLAVINDAPQMDFVYKLVEYEGRNTLKLSSNKTLIPGRKQVFRQSENNQMTGDIVAGAHEEHPGQPLLQVMMQEGKRTPAGQFDLEEARTRLRRELACLPEPLTRLDRAHPPYSVHLSNALEQETQTLRQQYAYHAK